jgi:hypothetical protein
MSCGAMSIFIKIDIIVQQYNHLKMFQTKIASLIKKTAKQILN